MTGLIQKVVYSANGQWPSIFSHLGIDAPSSGKHGPCPVCGGKDRFHFDNKAGRGTWYCRQCDDRNFGDGLDLVSKVLNITLYNAAKKIAELLNVEPSSLTAEEENMHSIKLSRQRKMEAKKVRNQRRAAAKRATEIWENSIPASPEQLYLRFKKIKPHGIRQLVTPVQNGATCFSPGTLVIPIMDHENNLISLEFISCGMKQGLAGGMRKNGRYILGDIESAKHIWIVEGFATGATIYELTGEPVVIAFTANNLNIVTTSVFCSMREAMISIAADDDPAGIKYARLAASDGNARIKIPPFNPEHMLPVSSSGKRELTDWNDYFAIYGERRTLEALYL
ncbi:toprim domain-containing protein [Shewanella abyssi]|uniref:primase-helicase zinc-binding domain-containing protein n=1 Tax=Shewanella abyssi TaxID=311789 RepID=UPI00200C8A7D|nr:primase-helicase zinc-binding domain-containing protein [Shewanella abyssi]MCL1050812.1 toprim domain-containing protein [Shewanella abyssi]